MKKIIFAATLAMLAMPSMATVTQNNSCPPGTLNCNTGDNQSQGDVSTVNNNGETHSSSSMLGNSSTSNASGNSFDPSFDNKDQNTNTVSNTNGSDHAQATGGASSSIGNQSDNKATVGNTSSNSGGNTTTSQGGNVGDTSASAGAVSGSVSGSNSGGNDLTNKQGQGQGQGQGQSQGIAGSGNSDVNSTLISQQGQSQNNSGNSASSSGAAATQSQGIAGSGNSDNKNSASNISQQGQSQSNSGNSRNDVKSSNSLGNSSSTSQGQASSNKNSNVSRSGSDNAIKVDASDRSSYKYEDNTKYIFIPSIIPATPPSVIATGNIVKETTACGPLQKIEKTQVVGKFFGLMSESDVEQGFTYDLVAWYDDKGQLMNYFEVPLPDGSGVRLIGHQAIIFSTVVGTANARHLALGGGGSGGNWGQGGTGTSATNQQLVTNIQLRHCEIGIMKSPVVVRDLPVTSKILE